jgi:predicted DNA-binding protein
MSDSDSRKQKLIRAPSDLVSKLSRNASRQGKTLYSYVSEIFEQATRAYEMKRSLREILDDYEILEVPKEAGTIYTPRDVLDYLIQKTYGENGEKLQQLWYNAGKWYGICLKERFEKPLEIFLRLMQEGRWDLNEVTMNHDEGKVEFRCVSAFIPQERTLLLENFIEGAMHSLGYVTREKNCFKGIIRLKFFSVKHYTS